MKLIIEIDDDLVQAQIVALTQDKKDRQNRETLKTYFREHTEVTLPTKVDEEFSVVLAVMSITTACEELDL